MISSTRNLRILGTLLTLLAAAGCNRSGNGDGAPHIAGPDHRLPDFNIDPTNPNPDDPGHNDDPFESACVPETSSSEDAVSSHTDTDDGGVDFGVPGFSIAAAPSVITIPQGGSRDISVVVARDEGFEEPIDVTVDGLPEGVSASPLQITVGQTGGTISLSALPTVAIRDLDDARVRGRTLDASNSSLLSVRVRSDALERDTSFGMGGAHTDDSFWSVENLLEQPDGKVVFLGRSASSISLCRLDPSGAPDLAFGTANGCVVVGPPTTATSLSRLANGKLVVGWGDAFTASVARYTTAGDLDASFAESGIAMLTIPGAGDVRVLPLGGKLFVAKGDVVARLHASGEPDSAFGTYGRIHLPNAGAIVRHGDCGFVVSTGDRLLAIDWRGDRDLDFGHAGEAAVPFEIAAITTTQTGEIVAAAHDAGFARVTEGGDVAALVGGAWFREDAFHHRVAAVSVTGDGRLLFTGEIAVDDDAVTGVTMRQLDGTNDAWDAGCTCGAAMSSLTGGVISREGRVYTFGTEDHSRAAIERRWD